MDPATAAALTEQAWRFGGMAGVLLLALLAGGWLMFRFFVKMVDKLGSRLDQVQGAQARELAEVVKANTASNQSVTAACVELRQTNSQIVEALRLRPCLIESGKHPVIKTPLPQKYHQ